MTQEQFNFLLVALLIVGAVLQVLILYGMLLGLSFVMRSIREAFEAPRRNERTAKLAEFASRAGVRFLPEADLALLQGLPFNLFKQPRGQLRIPGLYYPEPLRNLFEWSAAGVTYQVFDFQYRFGKGHLSRQTVCLVTAPALSLPRFTLRPEWSLEQSLEKLLPMLAAIATTQDIDFAHSPDFSRTYFLSGPDEAATRAQFNQPLIDCIMSCGTRYTIDALGTRLLIYQSGVPLDEPGIARLIEHVVKILNALGGKTAGRVPAAVVK